MRLTAIVGWLTLVGCFRPSDVAPLPVGQHRSAVLIVRGPGGSSAEARDLDAFDALPWAIFGQEVFALLFDLELAALRLEPGPISIASPETPACFDNLTTLEVADRLPPADRSLHLDQGEWKDGVPSDVAELRVLRALLNPCVGLEASAAVLLRTSTIATGFVHGAALTFFGEIGEGELIAAWPEGELVVIKEDSVATIATGFSGIVGGAVVPGRRLWLIGDQGRVRCWDFTSGECAAPTPALPEMARRFATLSVPEDGSAIGTLAAIDTGGLFRLDEAGRWSEVFRAGYACDPDPSRETCNAFNSCAECRLDIVRRGQKAAVAFRASAEVAVIEETMDGPVLTVLQPPGREGRPEDSTNVVAFDDLGRLIAGHKTGIVQRQDAEGHWALLGAEAFSVEVLRIVGSTVFIGGTDAVVGQIVEHASLGPRQCGSQTLRGVQEALAILPLGDGFMAIGDGNPDLNLLRRTARPGPSCPQASE